MSDKWCQDTSIPYTLDEAIDELEKWLGNEEPLFPIEQAVSDLHWLRELRAERDTAQREADSAIDTAKIRALLADARRTDHETVEAACEAWNRVDTAVLDNTEAICDAIDVARSERDTAQREAAALRAVFEALPRCDHSGCERPATMYEHGDGGVMYEHGDGGGLEHGCDEHGAYLEDELPWADAVRRLEGR